MGRKLKPVRVLGRPRQASGNGLSTLFTGILAGIIVIGIVLFIHGATHDSLTTSSLHSPSSLSENGRAVVRKREAHISIGDQGTNTPRANVQLDKREGEATETSNSRGRPGSRGKEISEAIRRNRDPPNKSKDLHFVHIPKCGGTSMTAVLRQIVCALNPARNVDCCRNPGFCDYGTKRLCKTVRGCHNHIPQRRFIFNGNGRYRYDEESSLPSVTITVMREPVSRTLSAFFYRGHSPNNDFFQVRPYFKQIRLGLLPKVDFPEYIEMTEYQNIQTRMLGADSFPYRNVSIDEKIYERAKKALDSMYFVGLQEAYGLSVELLVRDLNVSIPIAVKKERDMGNSKSVKKKKKLILGNTSLMDRVKERNRFDIMLHQRATQRFCTMLKGYPDLYAKLDRTRVSCD